jgi:hypothetical protein
MTKNPVTDYVLTRSRGDFSTALDFVRRHLEAELRRRGLMSSSPALLDIDHPRWDAQAMHDLAVDGFLDAVASNFGSLLGYALRGRLVEGAVVCNLKRFVTLRQKRHAPAPYQTFKNLAAACEYRVGLGSLFVVAPVPWNGRIVGETVLCALAGRGRSLDPQCVTQEHLECLLADALATDLEAVGATCRAYGGPGLRAASAIVDRVVAAAAGSFQFGDLHRVVCAVRASCVGPVRFIDIDDAPPAALSQPADIRALAVQEWMEWDAWHAQVGRARAAISSSNVQETVKEDFHRIWTEWAHHLSEGSDIPDDKVLRDRLGLARSTFSDRKKALLALLAPIFRSGA